MTWTPGQSGNPNGYSGPRIRRRHEVFELIKGLGPKDALLTLSTIQHDEKTEPGLRIAAASALAPFCHPKLQATPTPRFIETPIDVPGFTSVEIARDFIATVTVRVARGELDFQSGQELIAMAKIWLDAMNDQSTLDTRPWTTALSPSKSFALKIPYPSCQDVKI